MNVLHHLDLFSGIGGFALAARWTERIETVAFCDNDPFCKRILQNQWPNALFYEDIHSLTADRLRSDGVARIDLLTGGFPCQPFSIAGKRGGAADDRHLWPQMRRLIAETQPRWIVGENVAHFIPMALDACLSDLEAEGYEAWPLVLPACAVGAPHQRDRVFIVACAEDAGKAEITSTIGDQSWPMAYAAGLEPERLHAARDTQRATDQFARAGSDGSGRTMDGAGGTKATNSATIQNQPYVSRQRGDAQAFAGDFWATEPAVGRMAYGILQRLDRLRSLGNAVVPQVVFPILNAIVEWEIRNGYLTSDAIEK